MVIFTHFKRAVLFLSLLSAGLSVNASKRKKSLPQLVESLQESDSFGATKRLRLKNARAYFNDLKSSADVVIAQINAILKKAHGKTRRSFGSLIANRDRCAELLATIEEALDLYNVAFDIEEIENQNVDSALYGQIQDLEMLIWLVGADLQDLTQKRDEKLTYSVGVPSKTQRRRRASHTPKRLSFSDADLPSEEELKGITLFVPHCGPVLPVAPVQEVADMEFDMLLGDGFVNDGLDHKHVQKQPDVIRCGGYIGDEPVTPVQEEKIVKKAKVAEEEPTKKAENKEIEALNILSDKEIEKAVNAQYQAIKKASYKVYNWFLDPYKSGLIKVIKDLQKNPAAAKAKLFGKSNDQIRAAVEEFLLFVKSQAK